jgi:hypothetical protein
MVAMTKSPNWIGISDRRPTQGGRVDPHIQSESPPQKKPRFAADECIASCGDLRRFAAICGGVYPCWNGCTEYTDIAMTTCKQARYLEMDMPDTFADALAHNKAGFAAAGQEYPGLKLDLLFPCGEEVTYKKWMAFVKRKGGLVPGKVEWDCSPDNQYIARFHGNLDGYKDFQRLAADAYDSLCDTDPAMPREPSYHGWLQMIHQMSLHCRIPAFDAKGDCWGFAEAQQAMLECLRRRETTILDPKDWVLHFFPFWVSFDTCLFQISSAVCQMFLDPYNTTFSSTTPQEIQIVPWQLAAVFANPRILECTPETIAESGVRDLLVMVSLLGNQQPRPVFIEDSDHGGRLMVEGHLLRRIKANSTSLCAILREFERRGWPKCIETPTTLGDPAKAGRDFVKKMNENQEGSIRIHFDDLNSGTRLTWRALRPAPNTLLAKKPTA